MANTVVISRVHLIYGICLPVAVLMGYLLASPYDSGSIAVLVMMVSVLSIPILLRWHHAILFFSVNAVIIPLIPGRPTLWMIMACVSFLIIVLNRSIGREVPFFRAKYVSLSLLFLALVVFVTSQVNGGIHLSKFGGGVSNAGGKRYLFIFCAIFLYFGLATTRIAIKHANAVVAVFFLSALTGLVGYLAAFGGPAFYFLVELFPVDWGVQVLNSLTGDVNQGIVRFGGLGSLATAIGCFILARYGIRDTLDLTKPWRLMVLLVSFIGCLCSGFRSDLILFLCIVGLLFYMEGLVRTRYFLILIAAGILGFAVILPFTQKLPLVVQRTLAFLPINVDPIVRGSADDSTDWRLEMWREVVPTIPKYLLKGKGYAMDGNEYELLQISQAMGLTRSYESSILAGDFHSGPLSVIIPFGIFGVIGFVWFLAASIKVLRQNMLYGDPALKKINTFLLIFFIARLIEYLFIFGSLYSDLYLFTALIGLGVSLNGKTLQPNEQTTEDAVTLREKSLEYNY